MKQEALSPPRRSPEEMATEKPSPEFTTANADNVIIENANVDKL